MYICDDHHEEIGYNDRLCLECEAREEINRLELECDTLREEIEEPK